MLRTIAGVLGVEAPTERPLQQTLQLALRDKQLLLVLDNFEQLLAAAPQVAGLLGDLPRLRVLLTSRARLQVRGERVYDVEPLALPPLHDPAFAEVVASFPAARLFATAPAPSARTLPSPMPMRAWSPKSATGWRACRSPWNWPPRG